MTDRDGFVPLSEPTEEQLAELEAEYIAERESGTARYWRHWDDIDSFLADVEAQ